MAKARRARECREKGEDGVRRKEGRGQRGSGQGNMGWVDARGRGTEYHPVGHYGPITKTLSARQ